MQSTAKKYFASIKKCLDKADKPVVELFVTMKLYSTHNFIPAQPWPLCSQSDQALGVAGGGD